MASSKKYRISDSTAKQIEGKVLHGERLSPDEALFLFGIDDILWLGSLADHVRRSKHPEPVVTYVIDRNINYTNFCVTQCHFCAFHRKPGAEGGYVLSHEEIGRKIDEAKALGATSILLQGGHNPDLKIDYFEDLFRYIGEKHPIHLHALSPSEIIHIGRFSGISLDETLDRLKAAGLKSIPGGGAEILSDRVRKKVSPQKTMTDEWLGVMRLAHKKGIRSSATMMFGHAEKLEERVEHLMKIRDLQDETGGFTAFIPWTFQPKNTQLSGDGIGDHDNGVFDYLRTLAISRLVLDNVDNLQASWVTQGAKIAQVALTFGANDFGSTMIEENVVRAAGVEFRMSEQEIARHIREAGRTPVRRSILYAHLGKPLCEQ